MTLQSSSLLAGLLLHAEAQGADLLTLRALVEEASQLGAQRALASIGLHDHHASSDISELRELLKSWRNTKQSARTALLSWAIKAFLGALFMAAAIRLGFHGIL